MKHLKSSQSLIKVPSNVKCELKNGHLLFSGPLGGSFLSFTDRLSSYCFANQGNNKSVFRYGKLTLVEHGKQFQRLLVKAKSGKHTSNNKFAPMVEEKETKDSNSQTLCLSFKDKSMLETFKKHISNTFHGVRFGFTLYLRVVGVGYRVSYKSQNHRLIFKVGLSHDVEFQLPPSIRVFVLEPTLFCLFGINKNQVTQVGAKIRMIKPPEVYKGKGIRLVEEKIKLIQGKRK